MNTNIYRLIVMLLLASLLWGCAAPPSPTPEATAPPVEELSAFDQWLKDTKATFEGTEIKVAVASHPSIEAFKKMTPEFEEKTGIKVAWDEMEEGALAEKLLIDASAGTTSYDVIMNCPEFTPSLVDVGMLESIDSFLQNPATNPDWFDYEDIETAYRDMLSYNGKHYGVPFAGETVFLIYRKDIFEKHNLNVPTTMDELLDTAKTIQEKEPGMAGISMRTRLGWEFTYMWSVLIFPFGGRIVDPQTQKAGLNNPETLDSLKYFIDLAGYGPVGISAFSFPEAWDAFMQGKAGMMLEASAAAPEVENPEKSVVVGNVGYAPVPAGPAGAYSGVWGWGFAITKDSTKKDAAWAFISYMTSKEKQDDYLANGGIVSRVSRLQDTEQQAKFPYYQAILQTLEQAAALQEQGLGVVLMIPAWSQISEVMGTEGSRALTKEITPEEATESMQTQVSAILGQ